MISDVGLGPTKALGQVVEAVPENGPAFTRPAGNVSEIEAPGSEKAVGFVSVMVIVAI
jgi:hypothetical protein